LYFLIYDFIKDNGLTRYIWIHGVVVFLAILSMLFLGKYFYDAYYLYSLYWEMGKGDIKEEKEIGSMENIYSMIKEKNSQFKRESELRQREIIENNKIIANSFYGPLTEQRSEKPQNKLAKNDEYIWVEKWNIFQFISNIIQFSGAALYLAGYRDQSLTVDIIMGLGCFSAWLSIVSYIKVDTQYYGMFVCVVKSYPTLFRFLISVLPLLLGFAFLSICIMWISEYFTTSTKSIYSIFALFLGDIVTDSTERLPLINYSWANFHIYIVIIFFMFVIHTILLAIISKTYTQDVRPMMIKESGIDDDADDLTKDEMMKELAITEVEVRNNLDLLKAKFDELNSKDGKIYEKQDNKENYMDSLQEILNAVNRNLQFTQNINL